MLKAESGADPTFEFIPEDGAEEISDACKACLAREAPQCAYCLQGPRLEICVCLLGCLGRAAWKCMYACP